MIVSPKNAIELAMDKTANLATQAEKELALLREYGFTPFHIYILSGDGMISDVANIVHPQLDPDDFMRTYMEQNHSEIAAGLPIPASNPDSKISPIYKWSKSFFNLSGKIVAGLVSAAAIAIPFAQSTPAGADTLRGWTDWDDMSDSFLSRIVYDSSILKAGVEHDFSGSTTAALNLRHKGLELKLIGAQQDHDDDLLAKILIPIKNINLMLGYADLSSGSDISFAGASYKASNWGIDAGFKSQDSKEKEKTDDTELRADAWVFLDPVFLGAATRDNENMYVLSLPNQGGPVMRSYYISGTGSSDLEVFELLLSSDSQLLNKPDSVYLLDDDLITTDGGIIIPTNPFRYIAPEMDQRGSGTSFKYKFISPDKDTKIQKAELIQDIYRNFWLGAGYDQEKNLETTIKKPTLLLGYTTDKLQLRLELPYDSATDRLQPKLILEGKITF